MTTLEELYKEFEQLKEMGKRTNMLGASLSGVYGSAALPNPAMATTVSLPDEGFRVSDASLMLLLAIRMRMPAGSLGEKFPGLGLSRGEEKVFVHFVQNGELVVLEDSLSLFPSDELLAKLRLCL
jgi:hypothetical protein